MKKKAIKIAASTAVAASAFVAAAPANKADAAVNLDQIVQDAQNAGTVLKWAISVEGSADYVTRPYDQYNAAKKAIAAAEKALKGASTSDKLKYEARLTDPKIQVKRAQAYIDAITSSEKIKELTANLNAAVKSDDIEKVETAYHKATAEYRKQSALLDRVYGQSTRDGIRNAVKPALEKLVAELKNDVTVNMLAKAAAADVKAGKVADAGKKVAEAQAILDANVLKWETSLQKSVNDVVASLPLQPVSVSRVNDTTITVNFNKEVDAVSIAHFTFDNGLTATDVKLSADKKVATITTTAQAANKTYTLYYKGEQTKLTFVKTVGSDNSSVFDNAATGYVKVNDSRLFTATFKNTDGSPFRGTVKVKTSDADVKVTAINGSNIAAADQVSGTTEISVTPNNDGKVTIRISAATDADAKVTMTRQDTKKDLVTGTTYFVAEATTAVANTQVEVKYVNKEGKYFVANDGTNNLWFSYDSNDAYYDNATPLTQDAFANLLGNGNKIIATYNNNVSAAGVSDFNIIFKKTLTDLEITTPDATTSQTSPFRIAANQQFTLVGKGQPGYTVWVYRANDVTPTDVSTIVYDRHGSITVDGSGKWSFSGINLVQDELAAYQVVQLPSGVQPSQQLTGGSAVWLKGGAFTASVAVPTDVSPVGGAANNTLDVGESVVFTVTAGDTVKLSSPLSITVLDGDGTTATYTDGVNGTVIEKVTGQDNQFKVSFGASAGQPSGGNGIVAGSFVVTKFSGITNQHGLGLNGGTTVTGL
ncbi:hypothetical protein [Cytobacillus praedii]|uniref:hypothetical protein n=1 Tax=Cytobacillus praedii TaxID=1742358 RepID=UPI00070CC7B5|nr:hypothetical protein [Cytobacillus praedii]